MNYISHRALVIGLLIFSFTASMAQEEDGANEVYESKVLFTLPGVEAKSMYSNPSLDTFFIHNSLIQTAKVISNRCAPKSHLIN